MANEYIFLLHVVFVALTTICGAWYGSLVLSTIITAQMMIANVFVLKQTVLFGLNATCTDAYIIGTTFGLSVMQEYYGKQAVRNSILAMIASYILYSGALIFQHIYVSHTADIFNPYYEALFTPQYQVIIASACAFIASAITNYVVFGLLQHIAHNSSSALRAGITMICSQAVDTGVFSFIALSGFAGNLYQIIAISYSIKLITIALVTPFMSVIRLLLGRSRVVQ